MPSELKFLFVPRFCKGRCYGWNTSATVQLHHQSGPYYCHPLKFIPENVEHIQSCSLITWFIIFHWIWVSHSLCRCDLFHEIFSPHIDLSLFLIFHSLQTFIIHSILLSLQNPHQRTTGFPNTKDPLGLQHNWQIKWKELDIQGVQNLLFQLVFI